MAIYYHGTSADNLPSILKSGLIPHTEKLWSCSGREVYMWDVEKLAKAEGSEDDLPEWKEQTAYNRAKESGQIACAVAKDCRVVVLKIKMSSKNVYDDTSCQYMDGAVCVERVPLKNIETIWISNDLSLVKGLLLAGIYHMDMWKRNPDHKRIAEVLSKVEWYPEWIDDIIEWEQIQVQKKCSTLVT